jgi:hypothetical protein
MIQIWVQFGFDMFLRLGVSVPMLVRLLARELGGRLGGMYTRVFRLHEYYLLYVVSTIAISTRTRIETGIANN